MSNLVAINNAVVARREYKKAIKAVQDKTREIEEEERDVKTETKQNLIDATNYYLEAARVVLKFRQEALAEKELAQRSAEENAALLGISPEVLNRAYEVDDANPPQPTNVCGARGPKLRTEFDKNMYEVLRTLNTRMTALECRMHGTDRGVES